MIYILWKMCLLRFLLNINYAIAKLLHISCMLSEKGECEQTLYWSKLWMRFCFNKAENFETTLSLPLRFSLPSDVRQCELIHEFLVLFPEWEPLFSHLKVNFPDEWTSFWSCFRSNLNFPLSPSLFEDKWHF